MVDELLHYCTTKDYMRRMSDQAVVNDQNADEIEERVSMMEVNGRVNYENGRAYSKKGLTYTTDP